MKKLLILAAILISASAYSQTWNGDYDVSKYYSQGRSTFFFTANKAVKQVTIDFSNFNQNTAVASIGTASGDILGSCQLTFWNGAAEVDSVTLNKTTYLKYTKNALSGVTTSASRIYALFPDGLYSSYIAITITWNTVTTGRLKIRLEPQQ